MTKKEIEKGAGLLLAAVSGCEQMVELLRAAVHYCYEQEKTAKNLTPKGYAGFTRIHHIWTEGIPDVPKLFIGSPIQDRDMARGTLMAIFLSTTVFPAETIQIPVYAETCVLLDDLMAGGWYVRKGQISIGGMDVRTIEPEHLMRCMPSQDAQHIKEDRQLTAALIDRLIDRVEVSREKRITVRFRFQSEFEHCEEVLSQCRNM